MDINQTLKIDISCKNDLRSSSNQLNNVINDCLKKDPTYALENFNKL